MSLDVQAIAVLLVASFNLILAGIILAQDLRNRTNIIFSLLCATAAAWGFGTGFFLMTPLSQTFWFDFVARFNYFAGGSISTIFLYLALIFDAEKKPSLRTTLLLFSPTVLFFYLYFFTNVIVSGEIVSNTGIRGFTYGPFHYVFDLHTWGYFGIAFIVLVNKYRRFSGQVRHHVLLITVATYITFAVAAVVNIILPHVFLVFDYIWVGPASLIFWLSVMTYAVARHQLFNVRSIATEALISFLWLALLFRIIFAQDESEFFTNTGFFVTVLVLGVFFIRSVIKEVEQKEQIEKQDKELAIIHTNQEALLNFISHEIKGYFAKIEAAFAGIKEGDYGEIPPQMKTMAENGFKDVRVGTAMVVSILDASNLKKGAVSYKKGVFDLANTARKIVEEMRPLAEGKGLVLTLTLPPEGRLEVMGDESMIGKHVIRNIIDNAVRYTPTGSIKVEVSNADTFARIVIEDSGIGITPRDKEHLFTEGGHGTESIKVNVHSTGYGLYIAKQVVEAHGGTIHAVSEGSGKGSRFIVELPVGLGQI